jgi:predicted house-cleaning noncanonical NTP pyrophosphatase (MazG superfamily)
MVEQEGSGKLVRDKIPDIIREAGGEPATVILNDTDYTVALRAKLLEEVSELLEAPANRRTEEAADVVEVLHAMMEDYGLDWDAVEVEALRKRQERGGFGGRIWLKSAQAV